MKKLCFLFSLAASCIRAEKRVFAVMLLSLAAAMTVPFFGFTLHCALQEDTADTASRYGAYPGAAAYAVRAEGARLGDEQLQALTEIPGIAVGTPLLPGIVMNFEYVLCQGRGGDIRGRLADVYALYTDVMTQEAYDLRFGDTDTAAIKRFAAKEAVCIVDETLARQAGITIGDTLTIRGDRYTVSAIHPGLGNGIHIACDRLPPGDNYMHTVYFFAEDAAVADSVSADIALQGFGQIFSECLPLSDTFASTAAGNRRMTQLIIGITGVFLLYAGISVFLLRRGILRLHRHDYAVMMAAGASPRDTVLSVWAESVLLLPPALACNLALLPVLGRLPVFPVRLPVFPSVLLLTLLLFLLFSLITAALTAKELLRTPLSVLLKEG